MTTSDSDKDSLGCPSELEPYFKEASEKYNVDINLLKAIAKAESNFNPNAVSSAGALGVMQLMPSTASSLGISNAYNARENIMGGAQVIASNLKKYNGDISLCLSRIQCRLRQC
ncbi:MAG: lytic transglycosylase domain-containing protein [Roseburia sp.]